MQATSPSAARLAEPCQHHFLCEKAGHNYPWLIDEELLSSEGLFLLHKDILAILRDQESSGYSVLRCAIQRRSRRKDLRFVLLTFAMEAEPIFERLDISSPALRYELVCHLLSMYGPKDSGFSLLETCKVPREKVEEGLKILANISKHQVAWGPPRPGNGSGLFFQENDSGEDTPKRPESVPHDLSAGVEQLLEKRLRLRALYEFYDHPLDNDEHTSEKLISDPMYGTLCFPRWLFDRVLDTRPVQRLHDLKQLGLCFHVYPGAKHSRYEHSIGVGHLAGCWWNLLVERAGKSLAKSRYLMRVRKNLLIAGICHDLGHGPFSHSFESLFARNVEKGWSHEDMSIKLFNMFIMPALKAPIYNGKISSGFYFSDEDGAMVCAMISGSKSGKPEIFFDDRENLGYAALSIIANDDYGIDVDRFDYMIRDAFVGTNFQQFTLDRLMHLSQVYDGVICFRLKDRDIIYQFFQTRRELYRRMYMHPKTEGPDLLMRDLLKEIHNYWDLTRYLRDPAKYLELNDSIKIWPTIHMECILDKLSSEKQESLKNAYALQRRLETRNFYKFCWSGESNDDLPSCLTFSALLPYIEEAHINLYRTVATIEETDVHIVVHRTNKKSRDLSPMCHVAWWNDAEGTVCYGFGAKDTAPLTMPSYVGRVFCEQDKHRTVIEEACRKWAINNISIVREVAQGSSSTRHSRGGGTPSGAFSSRLSFPRLDKGS